MSGVELYEQFGFDFLSNIWPLALTATKPTSSPAVKIEPAAVAPKVEVPSVQSIRKVESLSDDEDGDRASGQGDVQPVGHDYVEEVKKNHDLSLKMNKYWSKLLYHDSVMIFFSGL